MAKRGRKRKKGLREPNGRLSRAKHPPVTFDKGTERVQAMQALYGQDGADAIGRAYRAGLLGNGSEAKAMLDTARKISNAYWQAYETGRYTCTLADRQSGSVVDLDHERIRKREEWISEVLDFVAAMGHDVRRAFEQLVIDVHPDQGPPWLDGLLWADQHNKRQDIEHVSQLRRALDPLSLLSSGG